MSVLMAVLAGCQQPAGPVFFPTTQPAPHMRVVEPTEPIVIPAGYRYLLYVPTGSPPRPEGWPLVLYLHGAGERGSDLNLLRRHGPPKMLAAGQVLPFIMVAPQCPAGQYWEARLLARLLDDVEAGYPVDRSRVYVTGLSMGGFGTWMLACHQPHRFAAIAPICGGGIALVAGRELKDMPIWAFHVEGDPVVPLEESRRMVEAVNRAGGRAKLTIYPGGGHDAWTRTYEDPSFWGWLLSHRRDVK